MTLKRKACSIASSDLVQLQQTVYAYACKQLQAQLQAQLYVLVQRTSRRSVIKKKPKSMTLSIRRESNSYCFHCTVPAPLVPAVHASYRFWVHRERSEDNTPLLCEYASTQEVNSVRVQLYHAFEQVHMDKSRMVRFAASQLLGYVVKSWKDACRLRTQVCMDAVPLPHTNSPLVSVYSLLQNVPSQAPDPNAYALFRANLSSDPLVVIDTFAPTFATAVQFLSSVVEQFIHNHLTKDDVRQFVLAGLQKKSSALFTLDHKTLQYIVSKRYVAIVSHEVWCPTTLCIPDHLLEEQAMVEPGKLRHVCTWVFRVLRRFCSTFASNKNELSQFLQQLTPTSMYVVVDMAKPTYPKSIVRQSRSLKRKFGCFQRLVDAPTGKYISVVWNTLRSLWNGGTPHLHVPLVDLHNTATTYKSTFLKSESNRYYAVVFEETKDKEVYEQWPSFLLSSTSLAYIRWVCEYPTHPVDEQEVQLMIASVETYDCVIYDLHAGKRVYTSPALACYKEVGDANDMLDVLQGGLLEEHRVCLMENGDMVDVHIWKERGRYLVCQGTRQSTLYPLHGSAI